jgi:hypothetical protein
MNHNHCYLTGGTMLHLIKRRKRKEKIEFVSGAIEITAHKTRPVHKTGCTAGGQR